MQALYDGDVEFFKSSSLDINHRLMQEDNDTLLLFAIALKDTDIYQYFLQNGADTMLTNGLGENIFHSMVFSNKINRLEEVLQANPSSIMFINAPDKDDFTPLHCSIILEKIDFFKAFLELGADIHLVDKNSYTALHLICQIPFKNQKENLEIARILLQKGANPFLKTKHGNYPLSLAINRGLDDVAKLLIDQFGITYPTKNSNLDLKMQ